MWASQFVLVKIVQEQMGPVAATSIPMLIATVLLFPIVQWEARSRPIQSQRRGKDWLQFMLIGVLGQVVAQLFITWGLRFSLASKAALLMLALPIATTVMAYFLLGEIMSPVRWLSFALAVAGVVECSGGDWKELSMVIFLTVLTRLDATQASLSNYMIPFFGLVIAAVVLHAAHSPHDPWWSVSADQYAAHHGL